jgi:uncharacterized NAD(P)/FAD-binding protein YdhS
MSVGGIASRLCDVSHEDAVESIAVVGGGAAGTLAAIALLRHPAPCRRRVVVIEPAGRLGEGVAYSTRSPSHLLNVRAAGMSALVDRPDDFFAWAARQGLAVDGTEFLPRHLFASYLRDALAASRSGVPAETAQVEHRRDRVLGIRSPAADTGPVGPFVLDTASSEPLVADHVILATGHPVPRSPWLPGHPAVIADAWADGAIESIRDAAVVLVVGTGLTAVDVVLRLRDLGHEGMIHLVSSHGRLPERHLAALLPQRSPALRPHAGSRPSLGAVVRAVRRDAAQSDDWRQAVDGLRPVTVPLWRGFPLDEQRRALRHLARRWEVLRHRMAPEVADGLEALLEEGRLDVRRGRVIDLAPLGVRIRAGIASGGTVQALDVDAVVLCTGPRGDPLDDPLLGRLIRDGIATRHPLGLGLEVAPDGRVRRPGGDAWASLWALGSLRRGAEWESTAVPELRHQAHEVAAAILGGS